MIPPEEQRHLTQGPRSDEQPGGAGLVRVVVSAPDVQATIASAKAVLTAILDAPAPWPSTEEWAGRLPAWFVSACAPEQTDAEKQQWLAWWRGLDPAARSEAEKARPWSLDDWLFYLEPDERQWFWWSAEAQDEHRGTVWVEVLGWPTPVGALEWLLRAAGAESVRVVDD